MQQRGGGEKGAGKILTVRRQAGGGREKGRAHQLHQRSSLSIFSASTHSLPHLCCILSSPLYSALLASSPLSLACRRRHWQVVDLQGGALLGLACRVQRKHSVPGALVPAAAAAATSPAMPGTLAGGLASLVISPESFRDAGEQPPNFYLVRCVVSTSLSS